MDLMQRTSCLAARMQLGKFRRQRFVAIRIALADFFEGFQVGHKGGDDVRVEMLAAAAWQIMRAMRSLRKAAKRGWPRKCDTSTST